MRKPARDCDATGAQFAPKETGRQQSQNKLTSEHGTPIQANYRVTSQVWDAEAYDKNARFVSDLGAPVLELLAPMPGERILDIGCGDGVLTKKSVTWAQKRSESIPAKL